MTEVFIIGDSYLALARFGRKYYISKHIVHVCMLECMNEHPEREASTQLRNVVDCVKLCWQQQQQQLY